MRVIGVIGRSGSGKTTVIERLTAYYKAQGLTVGTLKDLKRADYCMDTEGKNTFRHKQAGAEPVTARAEHNTDIMFTHRLEVEELLRHYRQDVVLLEGFIDYPVAQILTGCDEQQLSDKLTPNVLAVSGIYASGHKQWLSFECFDIMEECEALGRFLLERVQPAEEALPKLYWQGEALPLSYAAARELKDLLPDGAADLEYK